MNRGGTWPPLRIVSATVEVCGTLVESTLVVVCNYRWSHLQALSLAVQLVEACEWRSQ